MKWIKLTAFLSILLAFSFSLSSCERASEEKKLTDFQKSGIVMSYSQEPVFPVQTPSPALGSMDVFYTRETRILTYSFKWSGLTGPVTAFHIHGLAPAGYSTAVVQTFVLTSIIPCAPGTVTTCGSYSGTLLIDGVVVKEQDLLNGLYYINIHTTLNPSGEIRGQIRFQ